MYVRASTKGQIVLPAELRRKYHVGAGSRFQVVDAGTHISLFPVSDDPIQDFRGLLREGTSLSAALLDERRRDTERER